MEEENELETMLTEYQKLRAEINENLKFMKTALIEEISQAIPCLDRVDLCNLMEYNINLAEECWNMYVDLMKAGYVPPGILLKPNHLYN